MPTPEPGASAPGPGALAPALALALAVFLAFAYLNLTLGWLTGLRPTALGVMAGTATALTAWVAALPGRARALAALALAGLVAALVFVDLTYFRYFMSVPSPRMLGYGGQMAKLPETQTSLLAARDLLLAAPALLAAGSAWALGRRGATADLRGLALAAAAGVLTVLGVVGTAGWPTTWQQAFRLQTAVYVGAVPMQLGELATMLASSGPPPLPAIERQAIEAWLAARNAPRPGAAFAGLAKGRDLIVIQVEALQGFVVGREVDGRPVTPRLNALAREMASFPAIFVQTSAGGTSDAELLTQASLYPREQGAAFILHAQDAYASLPQVLRGAGYTTAVMHANTGSFWNRDAMYGALGIDHYFHAGRYAMDDQTAIGLSDASFFRQSRALLATLPRPRAATLITLTSHYPFKEAGPRFQWTPTALPDTMVRRYLGHIAYTDAALGRFVDDLKADGTWDRSVVVIFGDHNAIPFHQRQALFGLVGSAGASPWDWATLQRVPLLIHAPGLPAGVHPVVGGQIDVAPTVANLLGVRMPAAFGRDLLNADAGFAAFRNGSAVDDRLYWHADSQSAWDTRTGTRHDGPGAARLAARAARELRYSDAVLIHDLVRTGKAKP